MLKRALFLTALAGMVFCLGSMRAVAADETGGLTDEQFVTDASAGNLAEINMAQLALTNSTNPDVRKFAQRMIDDHTRLNRELNAVADRDRFRPAATMNAKEQMQYNSLARLRGAAFDRAYAEDMVKDHNHDVAELEKASKSLKSKDLKEAATKALPVIKEHDKLARKLADKLGVKVEKGNEHNQNKENTGTTKKH
jgi:putative membrane protein